MPTLAPISQYLFEERGLKSGNRGQKTASRVLFWDISEKGREGWAQDFFLVSARIFRFHTG